MHVNEIQKTIDTPRQVTEQDQDLYGLCSMAEPYFLLYLIVLQERQIRPTLDAMTTTHGELTVLQKKHELPGIGFHLGEETYLVVRSTDTDFPPGTILALTETEIVVRPLVDWKTGFDLIVEQMKKGKIHAMAELMVLEEAMKTHQVSSYKQLFDILFQLISQ
jgi:hypothetical protein